MSEPAAKYRATVTKRTPAAVNPDLKARLAELQQHQAVELADNATPAAEPIKPDPEPPPQRHDPHALQSAFLTANLNRVLTVFTLNGVKLIGRLRQFDQYCILLEGPDGLNSLIFKHAVSTMTPAA